ncbi:flippase-like domain-containing protein [Luteolibacter flavescens]|uniref:Flippase-like domain-containing protein n=1 Tax=Luteolibacter flavescens TaxID=1859460 RepID=A0ABT3FQZ3_9BACT|nr:lysylphosphatidylglycerol synthase transmembrane domain-containing protein [Luteolibacter flavescens]MCW1885719.1 flippase-like domain-containing protein [Luteolibacter flavescens]
MKKWLLFLAKLAFTVACLWWALSGQNLQESATFWPKDPEWSWALAAIALGGVTVFLSAFRWWMLLLAQGIPVTLWRATQLTLISGLFNLMGVSSVTGDAAKIFLLIRDHREQKLAVTMSVLVDHLVGLVAMALTFFAVTATSFRAVESQSELGETAIKFGWVYFSGGLAMIALMCVVASPWVNERIHRRVTNPRIVRMKQIPDVYDVFRKKWKLVLPALVSNLVMLPLYYATFWCGVQFVGSDTGFMSVFAAMPVVDAASAMPVSISGIGVREIALKTLMSDLVGLEPGISVLGSLVGFATGTLFWAFAGGLLFLRPSNRTSMKEIEETTQSEA